MNRKLKTLEKNFFERYPLGFKEPEMIEIGKKHKMDKMISFVQESFAIEQFSKPKEIIENISRAVTRSSMVSVFEKAKFRDYIKGISGDTIDALVWALKERIHGDEKEGFELFVDILAMEKLAKWPIVSCIPLYFKPDYEIFMKPTTVKNIVKYFDMDIVYKPQPKWGFYEAYRIIMNDMKSQVSPELFPNNAAFSGFFMMTIPQ